MSYDYSKEYPTDLIVSSRPVRDGYKSGGDYLLALEEHITKMEEDWLEVRNCGFGTTRFRAVAAAEKYVGGHPQKHRPEEYG